MHDDLLEVASLIVRELRQLGVRFSGGMGLNFIDEEAGEYRQLIAPTAAVPIRTTTTPPPDR